MDGMKESSRGSKGGWVCDLCLKFRLSQVRVLGILRILGSGSDRVKCLPNTPVYVEYIPKYYSLKGKLRLLGRPSRSPVVTPTDALRRTLASTGLILRVLLSES
jgi:hypothetical protein